MQSLATGMEFREGHFHSRAVTMLGVIRYGPDPVVALIDAANAGRNVSEWLGTACDVPIVASLDAALQDRGPEPALYDKSAARLITTIGSLEIYRIPHP